MPEIIIVQKIKKIPAERIRSKFQRFHNLKENKTEKR